MTNLAPVFDVNGVIAEYLFNDDNQGQLLISGRTYEDTATASDGVALSGTIRGSANILNAASELALDGHNNAGVFATDDSIQFGQGAISLGFRPNARRSGVRTQSNEIHTLIG